MSNPVSLLLVTMLSSVMSMAILGSLRSAAIPGVGRWMAANVLSMVSLALFALQGTGPAWLTVVGANVLLAIVVMLVLQGCRQFFGRPPSTWREYLGCAAVLAGMVYWTYASPDIPARIVVVSAFHAYLYAVIGWTIAICRAPGRLTYSHRFAMAIAWIGAAGHACRGVIYLAGFANQTALLESTALNILFLTLGILALPALSVSMVMLAHDRMAERLEYWANFDELTGALTRRAFIARSEAILEETIRAGGRVSIAIIDIDHFKSINDLHGHGVGDQVLARFGRVIAAHVRATDVFGRLGGEEFAVLMPGAACEDALARADALRAPVRAMSWRAPELGMERGGEKLSFSAGVAECRPGESLTPLMARADEALYAAKRLGRDRVLSL